VATRDDPAVGPSASFTRQGPFYRLQLRLGLVSETDLAVGRRGLLFVAVAWLPAIALAALQGHVLGAHHERSLLLDFSAYALTRGEQSLDSGWRKRRHQRSVNGPSAAPSAPAMPMPRLYQTAMKAGESSMHASA